MNVGHSGRDELAELKLLAALADLHRAQFAGPLVDVLEEMTMDGAQMGEVERAAWNRLEAAVGGVKTLDPIQINRVG